MSLAPAQDDHSCPCLSLPRALCAVAQSAGFELDLKELCAAMGLSFTPLSVRGEPSTDKWRMYARDAFLIPAGRLFGMTIREIHPPEAAIGIADLPEFKQHFDASYRPLIERALEHDQAVLAWQGWPGAWALHWGVITDTCADGIGFAGWVPGAHGLEPADSALCSSEASPRRAIDTTALGARTTEARRIDVTLERPPVQVYVVESIVLCKPDPQELRDMAIAHARIVLENGLADRFDVATGPGAYDDWIDRLRTSNAKLPSYLLEIAEH